MILMIDNYDSFTYNVVQYLGELGADVAVYRNDDISTGALQHDRNLFIHWRHTRGNIHYKNDYIRFLNGQLNLSANCLFKYILRRRYISACIQQFKFFSGPLSR